MNSIPFAAPDVVILSHARSGTHFLSSALASHPQIHTRDECVVYYEQCLTNAVLLNRLLQRYIFTNKPAHCNLLIVMYTQVKRFEQLCGPLSHFPIIHLLRNPEQVARSVAVMSANRLYYGEAYKSHYEIGEAAPPDVPCDFQNLKALKAIVEGRQKAYTELLDSHPRKLTVQYEHLTDNRQVTQLPEPFCREVLAFLQLDYIPLRTKFRKSGPSASAVTP